MFAFVVCGEVADKFYLVPVCPVAEIELNK